AAAEPNEIFVAETLITKQQNLMLEPGGVNLRKDAIVHSPHVDAADLGAKRRAGRNDLHELCAPGGLLLLPSMALLLLGSAGASQDTFEAVIAFMTGVLVDLLVRLLQRNHRGPRPHPGCRIVEGHLVLDRVLRDACEPFRHMQVLARSH